MYKKAILIGLFIGITTSFLTSCGQTPTDSGNQDTSQDEAVNQDQIPGQDGLPPPSNDNIGGPSGGSGAIQQGPMNEDGNMIPPPSGSGSEMRGQRGSRSGSGGIMPNMTTEDQTLFKQMMDAERSGDTATATKLRTELKQKYPNLPTERGMGKSGSGRMTPPPEADTMTNQ